ncbi:MAG: L-threonylcarbamoyladenylate synthase [Bacteriovoracaceae bacterium]|jgi:tRNA threonylcarbamoyl adenosine modification protein (Sua5/YciO/YrdC/YwlC family)|nr:threonylcarbamoyl-AMP synthase [Halobacteriovoraceae bacterium]MDP7320416.1 L-threonylcarbamoyladenylate synthase [Bacteriovoracaceae bacterium]
MIEYVIAHNPDDRILKKASELLSQGQLVCFPTDTNWILAACSTQKDAIEKLYKIKKENTQKHFSILCNDISMASDMALIDNQAFKLLKKIIPGHYTFIFEATKKMSKLIKASKTDKEVGIRFVPSILVEKIIQTHGLPLVSTNIPKSLLGIDEENNEPIYSYQLEDKINQYTSLIIDPGEIDFKGPSSIISFIGENPPTIIRDGSGSTELFS